MADDMDIAKDAESWGGITPDPDIPAVWSLSKSTILRLPNGSEVKFGQNLVGEVIVTITVPRDSTRQLRTGTNHSDTIFSERENENCEDPSETVTTSWKKRRSVGIHEEDTEREKLVCEDHDAPMHGTRSGENSIADTPPCACDHVNTRPTQYIQSNEMTCEEMFRCLVHERDCQDVTSRLDPNRTSSAFVSAGGISDIWRGRLDDDTEVAIKVWRFLKGREIDTKSLKRAMREIYYWSKIDHENVQKLIGVTMFDGRLGMVSQWMEHGDLRQYMIDHPKVDRYSLCYQVATGVEHLHSRRMVHGDLKVANILVSRDGIIKISDFDHTIMSECSLVFSATCSDRASGGTLRWMAPELILHEATKNEQTDIYALGMTILASIPLRLRATCLPLDTQEIITNSHPYPHLKSGGPIYRVKAIKEPYKRPMEHFPDNEYDNQVWSLLELCWSSNPDHRPTAYLVLQQIPRSTHWRTWPTEPIQFESIAAD